MTTGRTHKRKIKCNIWESPCDMTVSRANHIASKSHSDEDEPDESKFFFNSASKVRLPTSVLLNSIKSNLEKGSMKAAMMVG